MKCNKCGNELNDGELFCGKCGNKIKKSSTKKFSMRQAILIITSSTIIILILIISLMTYLVNSNNHIQGNESKIEKNVNEETSTININIDEETKSNIKKLYNQVSGYGSSNIIKAMYWKLASGTPTLLIAYQDTERNGMYIQVEGTKVFKNYGDEESLYSGSGRTKRESQELIFSMYKDSDDHIFFTGDEFREIIE